MSNRPDWTDWILQKNNEAKLEESTKLVKNQPTSRIPVAGTPLHFQHHEDQPSKVGTKSKYGVYHGDNLIGEVETNGDYATSSPPPKGYEDHYNDAIDAIGQHHADKHGHI